MGGYKHLNLRYENRSRIKFIIDDSYFTYLRIYDKMVRVHPGHNIKYNGGIGWFNNSFNEVCFQSKSTDSCLLILSDIFPYKVFGFLTSL